MTHVRTLLIGRPRGSWSHAFVRDLSTSHNPIATWTATTIPAALAVVSTHTPDLVLVIQDTPDQFSRRDSQRLLATWPLSRLIVCHGPWCNGDGRNRDYWPLAVRVSHTDVDNRLRREFAALAGDGNILPWTAGRDEIAAAEYFQAPTSMPTTFTYRVDSADLAWKTLVSAQLNGLGGVSSPECDTTSDLLLIDADPLDSTRLDHTIRMVHDSESGNTLLLTNTPGTVQTMIDDAPDGRLEVHDKLVAAARPTTLVNSLGPIATRRIA